MLESTNDVQVEMLALARKYLREAQTGTPEESVNSFVEAFRAAGDVESYAKSLKDQAKAGIGEVMAETGTLRYDVQAGSAYVTKPSIRASYDTKALDALCASNADIARILAPHRKETEVAGSLTIKGKDR